MTDNDPKRCRYAESDSDGLHAYELRAVKWRGQCVYCGQWEPDPQPAPRCAENSHYFATVDRGCECGAIVNDCGVLKHEPQPPVEPTLDLAKFKKPQPAPPSGLTPEQLVEFRKAYYGFEAKPGLPLSEEVKDIRVLLDAHAAALAEIDARTRECDAWEQAIGRHFGSIDEAARALAERDAQAKTIETLERNYRTDTASYRAERDALRAENERLQDDIRGARQEYLRMLSGAKSERDALRALVTEMAERGKHLNWIKPMIDAALAKEEK